MVDFSSFSESDGAPMAESVENMVTMIEMIFGMNYLMEIQGRTDFAVAGGAGPTGPHLRRPVMVPVSVRGWVRAVTTPADCMRRR